MLCQVLKPISGPGGETFSPGTTVDTSSWRWEEQLVKQKKLRPVEAHAESLPEVEAALVREGKKQRGRPRKSAESEV